MALTITDLFNDATTREIGGIGPDQVNLIASDLVGVQQGLKAAFPNVTDLTSLHAQIIANQLTEEIASVENANAPTGTPILGTDLGQFVGRAINDIHRDIIDIAQGDPALQAVFNPTPLPALNTPAAPFHDDATQTAFVTKFIQESNHLGQAAVAAANDGFKGDTAGLVQQIQTFQANANAFDQSQGGLWSARFWNELRSDGTAGTAATALIDGLQTHNANEINAAAQQLAMNASDVGGNNLKADGNSYADVIAAAQTTTATTGSGQGASGTGSQASPEGAQHSAAGGNHGAQAGAGGSEVEGSAGASQERGVGVSHSSQAAGHGANGQDWDGILQHLTTIAQTHHGSFDSISQDSTGAGAQHSVAPQHVIDLAATAGPMHPDGIQDHGMHTHFAHMWTG
jgi:hypothetical protein